ncbi:acyltransferase [bacterium M00.F.Ca.ET.228.01.1.1]|uniref:acyltransferase family protein n=1 Tax=Paraburkholderia phenoliruptrix TaxID=252970 RepID=UPI001092FFBF|nr:acyltransferase [Paraburkholderia phenoliruptrix]TGP42945.1 acyltransferase [bacterium M00.F.Ca.ET.228.01.1.1]TGR99137.1 acyltransferase [bacterium M00.F.Ca.ET.191.01.1.1]TGU03448.1 acyltransferase [bacterium M00.F.Ca.ET.155.01.1.1]MBW0449520.1 acyltransferase [Paraburkholderia phenoliruptrix]MBW9099174.1 acyltransferase [Paraburkholderia phenoliruptrix]
MSDSALEAAGSSLPLTPHASPLAPRAQSEARADSAGKEHVIDAMRGFAALLVAYFHCRQIEWVGMQAFHQNAGHSFNLSTIAAYLTFPIAWGSAGVPIFFVISGYCIHRSAAMRLAGNPAYRLDAANFWARRFARIYPVLLAALLLTLALDWFSLQLPPVSHKIREIGLGAFLVNLFSLQGVAGKTYGSNGALWTLSLEVQFYAIYPLLFALRRRIGMNPVLAIVAVVNVVSAYALERHDIQFFTSYWFSWTLGAWIADAKAHEASQTRSSWGLYALAAAFVVLGCAAFHFGQYGAFQLWAIGFAFYLYRALEGKKGKKDETSEKNEKGNNGSESSRNARAGWGLRLLSRFGDFSFSLYLIHLPIFVLLSSLLYRSSLQMSIWPSFGYMLVAVPAAYVFYRLVELPAMKWSASLKPKAKGAWQRS